MRQVVSLGFVVFYCRSSLVITNEISPSATLSAARQILEVAFQARVGNEDLGLVASGFEHLHHFGEFVSSVASAGWQNLVEGENGAILQRFSGEDMKACQQYADESVFIFGDLLPLVLLPDWAFLSALHNEADHPALKHQRLVNALRWSWWQLLVPGGTFWAVPFFGALANLARRLRKISGTKAGLDTYRDRVLSRVEQGRHEADDIYHLAELSAPILSTTFSRTVAFRRACAWLSLADGKLQIEAAERSFKSLETISLRTILELAVDWPIFELLHDLARRPLGSEGAVATRNRAPYAGSLAAGVPVGQQRLSVGDALELYRMLHVFGTVCDEFGVRWWASHGTLLGALRDGGISRHADDCEVDVPETDVEVMQSQPMRGVLAQNGYELSFDPRGRCFKVWPAGSPQARESTSLGGETNAEADQGQLDDQTWWLPQQRVGTPSLDVFIVGRPRGPNSNIDIKYISNEAFHCNENACLQIWQPGELDHFHQVPFGFSKVWVPSSAETYLTRVYGADWNTTVRPHRWDAARGEGFVPFPVQELGPRRAAEPFGPLLPVRGGSAGTDGIGDGEEITLQ